MESAIIAFAAGLAAFLMVVGPAVLAPAQHDAVARIIFVLGASFAVATAIIAGAILAAASAIAAGLLAVYVVRRRNAT